MIITKKFTHIAAALFASKMQIIVIMHLQISIDTVMCHVAQEASTAHYGYIDRKKENMIFSIYIHIYCSSMIS